VKIASRLQSAQNFYVGCHAAKWNIKLYIKNTDKNCQVWENCATICPKLKFLWKYLILNTTNNWTLYHCYLFLNLTVETIRRMFFLSSEGNFILRWKIKKMQINTLIACYTLYIAEWNEVNEVTSYTEYTAMAITFSSLISLWWYRVLTWDCGRKCSIWCYTIAVKQKPRKSWFLNKFWCF
jgi:hypothetical protein